MSGVVQPAALKARPQSGTRVKVKGATEAHVARAAATADSWASTDTSAVWFTKPNFRSESGQTVPEVPNSVTPAPP